jgi:hypothetical protein
MAAENLVRQANRNGGADNITAVIARIGDGPIMEPIDIANPDHAESDLERDTYPSLRMVPSWLTSLLIILFFSSTIFFGLLLTQAGYTWKMQPPFIFSPTSITRETSVDLQHASYEDPVTIGYPYQVQSDPLILSPTKGTLSVVTIGGESIVTIRPNGSTIYKFTWSHISGTQSNRIYPSPKSSNWHVTTDTQGNIYVSDANANVIHKYSPSGDFIKDIAENKLKKPQSIVVDEVGNIYVIDNNIIKIIRSNFSQ